LRAQSRVEFAEDVIAVALRRAPAVLVLVRFPYTAFAIHFDPGGTTHILP
jgi:hypothetical protein